MNKFAARKANNEAYDILSYAQYAQKGYTVFDHKNNNVCVKAAIHVAI